MTAPIQALPDKVRELMAQYGVPGVAVGILHDGTEELAGFGVTNVNHPLPVDGDTLFQIGSTTKTVTATVAMMLVEAGKLDLDAPIRTYLPNFRLQDLEATTYATLRHCFTHMGGWLGDYFEDTGDGDDALALYVHRLSAAPQQTPLGSLWSYNNAGFSLAGRVIEVVAGQPYERVVQERLFAPLAMDRSFFFAKDAISHRVAVGHNVDPEHGAQVTLPWALARSAHPAGGVISSARDQLRYARFHLGDGAGLLRPETLQVMQRPWAEAGSMADHVGISWLLREIDGVMTVAHGGATNGQLSAFLMVPARNFAITVLTNANRGRELHRDLVNWALEQWLGLTAPLPQPRPLEQAALAEFAGRYVAQLSHLEVTATAEGLLVQTIPQGGFPHKDSPPGPTPPPSTLVFLDEKRLVFTSGPLQGSRAELGRQTDGTVAWLRVGGRVHKRVE